LGDPASGHDGVRRDGGAPHGREVTEAQAETILHAALDAGINYIDTSIDTVSARSASGATLRSGVPSTSSAAGLA
jgi:predicted aldo/keto reductase-like oxidoreductase